MPKMTSKEEIITAIRECAQQLGHSPNKAELKRLAGVDTYDLRKCFGSYTLAMREAGIKARTTSRMPLDLLFKDWAGVARKLAKLPTISEYESLGKYTMGPFLRQFRKWTNVPRGFQEYAERTGLAAEWGDVMELIRASCEVKIAQDETAGEWHAVPGTNTLVFPDQPMYGAPLGLPFMAFAPLSELAVVFMCGAMAMKLGFTMLRMPGTFPDAEAMRSTDGKRCQLVRVEFELESRNFLRHAHDPKKCDLIICWEHNWPECPLPVLELKTLVKQMTWELK